MKLYELPRNSKLRVSAVDGNGAVEMRDATFHHPDGMYSYCTVDNPKPDEGRGVFHLSVSTPMKLVDGRYEIDNGEEAEAEEA